MATLAGTNIICFVREMQNMDKASEVLLALRPVTFRYKPEIDPEGAAVWASD